MGTLKFYQNNGSDDFLIMGSLSTVIYIITNVA